MPILLKEPPPRKATLSPNQRYRHRFKPGDHVCYIDRTTRKKNLCYQLSEVVIVEAGYDKARNPRYKIEIINRVSISKGKIKRPSDTGKGIHPTAYDVDNNTFPIEQWDNQIQRKLNQTKALWATQNGN